MCKGRELRDRDDADRRRRRDDDQRSQNIAASAAEATEDLKSTPKPHSHSRNEALFSTGLLSWYDKHARFLPWRQDHDPYRVWLSEIMLQQTRVAAVIDHYHEFLRRFPTLEKLAAARESSVLAAWTGLGYYRRARMLHAAAKVIVREHAGKFPSTAAGLLALPGIGRYTAAAIASIAFDEPVAVVDGNVERVLQRVRGRRMEKEELWQAASELLDANRPGDFNQAMMELGAVVCTPRSPACLMCPAIDLCATRGELPAITKSAPQKKREIHYALHRRDEAVFLLQRPRDASLMAGMWELPEMRQRIAPQIPAPRLANRRHGRRDDKIKAKSQNHAAPSEPLFTLRHSITVTDYTVRVWPVATPPDISGKWIPLSRLPRTALTGLARKILRQASVL